MKKLLEEDSYRSNLYETPLKIIFLDFRKIEGKQSWIRKFEKVSALFLETVARRCFVKKVFLEILQYSQENTCARPSF